MKRPKILVVGDVMLDRYIHGVVERISPEAPIPILRQTRAEDRPGGAANVAMNLASLGAEVFLVAAVAWDESAEAMQDILDRAGVSLTGAVIDRKGAASSVKCRYVAMGQQMLRVDHGGTRPTDAECSDIDREAREAMSGASAVVLSDYAGGVLQRPAVIIAEARRLGVPVYVDPKGPDWDRYCGATLIKPNEAELRAVVGDWGGDVRDMLTRARGLIDLLQVQHLLVTQGQCGMTLISSDGSFIQQDARSGPVVDVTGAGDTVIATVAYMRAQDWGWPGTLNLAAKGAAAVCARHGTSMVMRQDIGFPTTADEPVFA